MRRTFILLLLLVPLAAVARDDCKYSAPRHLQADLSGVHAVRIEANSFDVHVNGSDRQGLQVDGRACASSSAALDHLTVTQHREGDRLVIELGDDQGGGFSLFGSSYRDLDATVALPSSIPVEVDTGSGDAEVGDVAQLEGHAGSGDLRVRHVTGAFRTSTGSGDIEAEDVGSLDVTSIGSGDLRASGIKGDARIANIGSGDVNLDRVGGNIEIGTLGSGDVSVRDVAGSFHLATKGSGDVDYHDVKGKVNVPRDDD